MRPDESVVADLAGGVVLVGRKVVEASSAGAGGELRFAGGTVLRPLRFGERTALVAEAAGRAAARDAVAAAVLAAATVERGNGDRALLETLALWMAGAAWDAPPFAEAALAVGRAGSWSLQDLLMTPASEVDRLAVHIAGQQRIGEWNAIIFSPVPAPDVPSVRARFADQLLRRIGREAAAVEEPADLSEPSSPVERSEGFLSGDAPGSAPSARAQTIESRERRKLVHLREETRDGAHDPQSGGPETDIAETLSHTPSAAPLDGAEQAHDAEARSAGIASGRTGLTASFAQSRWRASAVTSSAKGSASVNPDTEAETAPHRPATAAMTPPAAPRLTLPSSTAADRHPEPIHAATLDAFTLPDVFVTTTQLLLHEAASRPAHESRPLTRTAQALAAAGSSADEVTRTLARMLEDEADLRGVER